MSDILSAEERLRAAFERYWRRENADLPKVRLDGGLERSNIWSRGGYRSPTADGDWQAFKAGAAWQRRRKL